jgi:conjugative transfer signal peptidase TraF
VISKVFIICSVGLVLTVLAARMAHIRVISTDSSAPVGIYHLVPAPLTRGELVLACLPAESADLALTRGYLGAGNCPASAEPVAKIVGALPGDTVQLDRDFVAVNGTRIPHSPTLPRDSMNRPLEHIPWRTYRVDNGEVWLFGFNNPHSWDSRFWGSLPTSNVRGALRPILTW